MDSNDEFARLQYVIPLWRFAWAAMKIAHCNHSAFVSGARYFDLSIERGHRYRHVAGISRNAMTACAKYCVNPRHARQRAATRARIALVAQLVDIGEIEAARPLAQIAADTRLVTQLLRRSA